MPGTMDIEVERRPQSHTSQRPQSPRRRVALGLDATVADVVREHRGRGRDNAMVLRPTNAASPAAHTQALLDFVDTPLDTVDTSTIVSYAATRAAIEGGWPVLSAPAPPRQSWHQRRAFGSPHWQGVAHTLAHGSPALEDALTTAQATVALLSAPRRSPVERARYRGELLVAAARRMGLPSAPLVPLLELQFHSYYVDYTVFDTPPDAGGAFGEAQSGASLSAVQRQAQREKRQGGSVKHVDAPPDLQGALVYEWSLQKPAKGTAPAASAEEEFWIALCGIVFRIRPDVADRGRRLYYRSVLIPLHAGRDFTVPLLAMLRDGAAVGAATAVAPSPAVVEAEAEAGLPCDAAVSLAALAELYPERRALGATAREREHVAGVLALFVHDFAIIGVLDDGAVDTWE